jgi:uncharacterized protein YecE (DUF72 family)
MTVWVGTSGWQYRDWRGCFYPQKLAQKAWLEHYVERFRTVEVNNTFYRLPPRETFAAWAQRVPDDFVMVLKLSRYLSHIKRLKDPEEPVQRFLEVAEPLVTAGRLGPLLLQLPPRMEASAERLDHTLSLFPSTMRIAVEFRDPSWYSDEVRSVLVSRGAALVWADRLGKLLDPEWKTADWAYIRLHEGLAHPRPCYSESVLEAWAARVCSGWSDDEDVFVFFNNDPQGCAVRDAVLFAEACRARGMEVTRVPSIEEAPVRS